MLGKVTFLLIVIGLFETVHPTPAKSERYTFIDDSYSLSRAGACQNGWTHQGERNRCLKLITSVNTNASDGSKLCQQIGGTLASIWSEEDHKFILRLIMTQSLMSNAGPDWTRIGGVRSSEANFGSGGLAVAAANWYWEDLTPFNYVNWDSGHPVNGQNFLYLRTSAIDLGKENFGKFYSSLGINLHPALCQLPAMN